MKSLCSLLLVDDNSFSRYASQLVIKKLGLAQEVMEATNGQEALDLLLTNLQSGKAYPDMILLDWQMPIMDGEAFLEALQLTQNWTLLERVVIISSLFSPSQMQLIHSLGGKWILTRPLTEDSLRKILDKWPVAV
ncbi:MAG: response regulator [Bacteroidota bacterium]